MLFAALSLFRGARRNGGRPDRTQWLTGHVCAAVWGLLWLTGKNAARRPVCGLVVHALGDLDGRARIPSARAWIAVAVAQGVVCIATVLRVAGFSVRHVSAASMAV